VFVGEGVLPLCLVEAVLEGQATAKVEAGLDEAGGFVVRGLDELTVVLEAGGSSADERKKKEARKERDHRGSVCVCVWAWFTLLME